MRLSRFCSLVRLLAAVAAMTTPLAAQPPTMFPPVRGTREMVGAANNFEVEAGYRLLTQGGNAVDAGVASVLAATVTEQSRVGLGGEMPALIKLKGKPVVAISGIGIAPQRATVAWYLRRQPEPWEEGRELTPIPAMGLGAAITPGLFDGVILALTRYGTKSFAEVAAPAIEYADGFPIGEEYASFIKSLARYIRLWPDSAEFFLPGGTAPERGTIYRSPALARTLRQLVAAEKRARGNRAAKLGAVRDLFYKGDLARRMAAFSQANGGLMAQEDLAATKAEVDQPRAGSFRAYQVHKPGFWTQGPVMIETLNLLEGFDLKAMGHNSPEYLHTVIEAVKLAFADRDRYYGDPKYSKIPEQTLLSKEYAAQRRKLIDPQRASMEHRPGAVEGQPAAMPAEARSAVAAHDTTCVNVVDRWGNAFSATPSGAWLPSVIAGDTGIPMSTRLQTFVTAEGHPNKLEPGKRPRVTLSPTLVTTKDGEFAFELSTPGGDNQDQALLQVLLNIVEFGMTPQEAVEAPRFQTEHFYSSFAGHEFTPGRVNLESRIGKETVDKLGSWGHLVRLTADWSNSSAPTVILLKDGVLHGAADPRRSRYIFGR
jgi:gamma-glutamyltranspeptidase / glutathione hydrolase